MHTLDSSHNYAVLKDVVSVKNVISVTLKNTAFLLLYCSYPYICTQSEDDRRVQIMFLRKTYKLYN